ncbi:DNA topoisomerase VI subunit B [Candidatus Woesearchaeota archaeon]|nr:DNA topoisomerase VI subunit B [Candidatus Woesearchaeota archaeon]
MAIAHELAAQQREISVSEFFAKNRHLLGFDNKKKALLTTIKEAVDNSLDACEEADILPEISVEVIDMQNDRFRIIVEDNGPGIVKKQIPNIFAKLLYGSKFHRMRQSRGQQGIGISASVMYAQLTTGRSAKITSKIGQREQAHYYELHINVQKNSPEIAKEDVVEWKKERGTRVELDIEASYSAGNQSVDEYLKQTAIANPSCTIIYTNPKAEQVIFPRVSSEQPKKPKEIKPHPYGVELGVLMNMLRFSDDRTIHSFLINEFSKVGGEAAKQILENAAIPPQSKPREMSREMIERLVEGIKRTKIQNPPTDCLSPIGQDLIEKGLRKEINAEFYASVTRSPAVYRGNPFQIEVGIAYGGTQPADQPIRIMRFANRVPLLYQQSACAVTKSIIQTAWRGYGLEQSQGAVPAGPCTLMVHMASVWVPFTSESKEAIAHYPEIIREIKLAVQEAGRRLSIYVNKKRRVADQQERVSIFENYIPEVADALARLSGAGKEKIIAAMRKMLEKNKEYIQAHKEAHQVEERKEEQARLGGFEDE